MRGKNMSHNQPLPRSFLYVPGDKPELFTKASASGADAVVLDLEDAVASSQKTAALNEVTKWISTAPDPEKCWVRVDPTLLAAQIPAVVEAGVSGIFLAKAAEETLDEADQILSACEESNKKIPVVGLVESASALVQLGKLASHPRLRTFGIGEVDLLADLAMNRSSHTESAITFLRSQIVIQCAAAGIHPPVAPTSTNFRDIQEFKTSTEAFVDLGFGARTAIHPAQVEVINAAFTPTADQIDEARDVLNRFISANEGVAVDRHGALIDAAVVRRAQRILSRASSH